MRTQVAIFAISLFLMRPASSIAQQCGDVPSLPPELQSDETLKGQLQGQAKLLSSLVGKGTFSGEVEAARRKIYQSSGTYFAARQDAFFGYMFCTILLGDTRLSALEKIKALNEFKRPPPIPVDPSRYSARDATLFAAPQGVTTLVCNDEHTFTYQGPRSSLPGKFDFAVDGHTWIAVPGDRTSTTVQGLVVTFMESKQDSAVVRVACK